MSDTTETTTTSQASEPPVRLSEHDQEAAVEALLSGKPITPEKAPDTAPGGDSTAAATEGDEETDDDPETGEESEAETPGIDYKQEIPLANGEKRTLGELKDHYQASAAREVAMIERENKVMQQTNELHEMSQYLNLPDDVRQGIARQQIQHLQAQHGLMLQAIPEWKDQATFEKARVAIFNLGEEYGVDLSKVADHRVVKMLNDFSRLKDQIKSAKSSLKQVKNAEPRAIQKQNRNASTDLQNAVTRAKQTGNQADQEAAVALLLRS